eukprot:2132821-Amphidinium_carterae.1
MCETSEELYKEAESRPGGWRGMREFRVKDKYALSKHVMHFELEPTDGTKKGPSGPTPKCPTMRSKSITLPNNFLKELFLFTLHNGYINKK